MDRSASTKEKKIWIDLENSPHVPFFYPIISELKSRGYQVVVTARNYAQVFGLADLYGMEYTKIGRHYGKNKYMKILGLVIRVIQMLPFYLRERPDLSFSHGSRSLTLVSVITGMTSVGTMDYEYGRKLPFCKHKLLLVPEVWEGENKEYISRYKGIKEDVYVPFFTPSGNLLEEYGIGADKIVAVVRPPADMAHYHNNKSDEMFDSLMTSVSEREDVVFIILPRTIEQGEKIIKKWAKSFEERKVIIPEKVVNGLGLIWYADMVISGGGTMIREAAALKVPAYSIFGGEIGAVDKYLEKKGLLTILKDEEKIEEKIRFCKKKVKDQNVKNKSPVLEFIVEEIEKVIA